LDEGIDYRYTPGLAIGERVVRVFSGAAQYQGIANTIVQLIRLGARSVLVTSGSAGGSTDRETGCHAAWPSAKYFSEGRGQHARTDLETS